MEAARRRAALQFRQGCFEFHWRFRGLAHGNLSQLLEGVTNCQLLRTDSGQRRDRNHFGQNFALGQSRRNHFSDGHISGRPNHRSIATPDQRVTPLQNVQRTQGFELLRRRRETIPALLQIPQRGSVQSPGQVIQFLLGLPDPFEWLAECGPIGQLIDPLFGNSHALECPLAQSCFVVEERCL